MSVKELRGLRTDNHARAVDLALVAAAAGQPVLVIVPRRSQARTWTEFVLRAAPNLSTVIRATT